MAYNRVKTLYTEYELATNTSESNPNSIYNLTTNCLNELKEDLGDNFEVTTFTINNEIIVQYNTSSYWAADVKGLKRLDNNLGIAFVKIGGTTGTTTNILTFANGNYVQDWNSTYKMILTTSANSLNYIVDKNNSPLFIPPITSSDRVVYFGENCIHASATTNGSDNDTALYVNGVQKEYGDNARQHIVKIQNYNTTVINLYDIYGNRASVKTNLYGVAYAPTLTHQSYFSIGNKVYYQVGCNSNSTHPIAIEVGTI